MWSALTAAHCGVCHKTFSGVSYFDAHRTGGRCFGTAALYDSGFVEERGIWSTPESHERRSLLQERLERAREARGAKR